MDQEGRRQEEKEGRRRHTAWTAAATAFLLILIGAFGVYYNRSQGRETVRRCGMFAGSYWDVPMGNSYQVVDDVIARFEAAHPGVRVEYISGIRKDDYSEWLSEQILLGREPDVFMIPAGEFDMLASLGVLSSLEPLIQRDGSFHAERYYQGAYGYGAINGSQYALPYESVPMLMFVNKTLLEKEGVALPDSSWTWQDFLDICRSVTRDTDGDGVIDQFGCYDYDWKDAVYANSANLFDSAGQNSYFGSDRVEEAVRFVRELTRLNQGFPVTSREFDLGRVAFMPLAYSEYRTYKPYPWRIKKYSKFAWDCVRMPAGTAGRGRTELDTLLMGIGNRSGNEQLAWELLKAFCYEEETQRQLLIDSQGVPVVRSALRRALLDGWTAETLDLDLSVLDQVMKEAAPAPNFRKYPAAMAMADGEITRMLNGETSMDSGFLKLQREINNYLKE